MQLTVTLHVQLTSIYELKQQSKLIWEDVTLPNHFLFGYIILQANLFTNLRI